LWLAVTFDLVAFRVVFEWDKRWHATHAWPFRLAPVSSRSRRSPAS
jgi:hypothetical protein